jgi:hypothetical protein
VSPLGVIPKKGLDKFRLTVNMRYVNRHLGEKKFKMDGLKDLADMVEKGDHAVSFDLTSEYYHVGLHPESRTFVGFKWGASITLIFACPSGFRRPLGSLRK